MILNEIVIPLSGCRVEPARAGRLSLAVGFRRRQRAKSAFRSRTRAASNVCLAEPLAIRARAVPASRCERTST